MIAPIVVLTLALQTVAPPVDSSSPSAAAASSVAGSNGTSPGAGPNGNYRIGHGVSMPVVIHKAEPAFPRNVGKLKDHDSAVVGLTIDAQGMPTNIHLVRSISDTTDPKQRAIADAVDQACIEAAKQYRFKPSMLQGKPVPVELDIETNIN